MGMDKDSYKFQFPLPFDPLRVVYGIREKWLWFIILPGILGLAGYWVGGRMAEDRYSVSLQMIRHESTPTVQAGAEGPGFVPRQLSDDTLLSTTYANRVLERAGARLQPPMSAGEVKGMVEINKQRNTALFYLTAHSRQSAEHAVAVVSAWADEVIAFTNELQKEEARLMKAFLGEQIAAVRGQLTEVEAQILAFAQQHRFVDVTTQTEAVMGSLENLRMLKRTTEMELAAKAVQIRRYREELRAQSPLAADLKAKRAELSALRGRYTDNNPLVQEKLYEIAYIEEQIVEAEKGPVDDLKRFTGNPLGDNLFLEILALENERVLLESQLAGYATALEESEANFDSLPSKSLQLSALQGQRAQLTAALGQLETRRKEAAFYESKAPGYWRVFQRAEAGQARYSSQNAKALLLGIGGGLLGGLFSLLAAVVWEYRQPGLRSVLDAAIVTKTRPVLRYHLAVAGASWWSRKLFRTAPVGENAANVAGFWLARRAAGVLAPGRGLVFMVLEGGGQEAQFWQELLDTIADEGGKVELRDLVKGQPLEQLAGHPAVANWSTQTGEAQPVAAGHLLIVRGDPLAKSAEVEWLRGLGTYHLFIAPEQADRAAVGRSARLLRQIFGSAIGLVILDSGHTRTLHRFIGWVESLLIQRGGEVGE